ncbi:MAG: ROK family protein, partial [Desulfonatronovibrio sp.]
MFVCIDLGASNIRGTWINSSGLTGSVVHSSRPKTLDGTKKSLISIVNDIMSQCPGKVQKIGLASAGPMDFQKGAYLNPTNMPELKNFYLRDFLLDKFGLEVTLENDAQAAALGEIFKGCLIGENDAMVFTLGTGLGSGVVLDNRIWRGKLPAGPELGHLYLGPGRRIKCGCGQTGCAETWLNAKALSDLVIANNLNISTLRDLDTHLEEKNTKAIKALNQYGHRLGLYLTQVISIFGICNIGLGG